MTRAVVVDQSLLAAVATSTLYSLPSFPGAAGSAWPAAWTTAVGSPAGTVTQDGAGYGTLQANNGSAWNASQPTARLAGISSAGLDLTLRFRAPQSVFGAYVPQFWPGVGIGVTSSAAGTGYFTSGYTMQIAMSNGSWSILDTAGNSLSGDVAVSGGYVPSAIYALRLQRLVTPTPLIRARLWLASAAEPSTWGYSATAALTAAGSVALLTGQGGDTEARPFAVTALTLTDGS